MKKNTILYKVIEDKTITWFENKNEYVVLENTTADILKRLKKGVSVRDIAIVLSKKLNVPLDKTIDLILELEERFFEQKRSEVSELGNDHKGIKRPINFEFIKYYKINNSVFKVSYLSEKELSFVHPKFAHLVIDEVTAFHNEFEVFIVHNFIFLYVNNIFIGSWNNKDIHYFQGKFSMEFIQKIHQKEENEWLGVFHASAISNGKKSMLFLGDSGNGKSTSLSLLQANGFTCLADDFVPMDAHGQQVYSFPAAISIKKSSLETLLPIYPELATSAEYNFKRLNKIVRYLKPNNNDFSAHLPCNDLVFIKYEKNINIAFRKISKIDAFQQLVPDSWLSPKKENAQLFLDWFSELNCYQLSYSNNEKMIETITKLFNNDL
jgi:sulfopyruvate decarboxylase TPP-binding subunit